MSIIDRVPHSALLRVCRLAFFGCLGFVMERNGYPVAALVLGIVMGTMVEQSFVTSLIKSDGSLLPFFARPVSAVLATLTLGALLWPLLAWGVGRGARAIGRGVARVPGGGPRVG